MATIWIGAPTEGGRQLALDIDDFEDYFEGRYEGQLPFTLEIGQPPKITFDPAATDSDYACVAEMLFGDQVAEDLRTAIDEGAETCEITADEMLHIVRRLHEYLASQPICGYCYNAVAEPDTLTCMRHRGEIDEHADIDERPLDEIITFIIDYLELRRPGYLLNDDDTLRNAGKIADLIRVHIPQQRWPELIIYTKMTDHELERLTPRIGFGAETVLNKDPDQSIIMFAQLAYQCAFTLLLRQLQDLLVPGYLRR